MRLERLASLARQYYEEYVAALEDYLAGRERVYAVERLAQLLAQAVLDYAALLASRERGVKPDTYRGLASYLSGKLGLGPVQRAFLEGLAGFRNILVHMYVSIDAELELEAFKEIRRKLPEILERMAEASQGDPCLDEIEEKLRRLGDRLGLRYIVVFGSTARRGCGNDVDLAVKLGRKPGSLLDVGRLQILFEDELGVPVDLVVLDLDVSPEIAKTIVDEGVLVYGDAGEYEEDRLILYKKYLDAAARPPPRR